WFVRNRAEQPRAAQIALDEHEFVEWRRRAQRDPCGSRVTSPFVALGREIARSGESVNIEQLEALMLERRCVRLEIFLERHQLEQRPFAPKAMDRFRHCDGIETPMPLAAQRAAMLASRVLFSDPCRGYPSVQCGPFRF